MTTTTAPAAGVQPAAAAADAAAPVAPVTAPQAVGAVPAAEVEAVSDAASPASAAVAPLPDPCKLPYLLPARRSYEGPGDLLTTAPMLDWSNRHWRYFVRLLTKRTKVFTEMVVDSTLKHSKNAAYYIDFHPSEHPIACQLGGSDPELLAYAARMVADAGYDEINLNVGCPSDRVAGRGAFGAALMFRPELVRDCVTAMHEAVGGHVPITVKCRLGADDLDSYEDFSRFIRVVASTGAVTHFIVHARKCLLKGLSPKDNRTIPPLKYHWVQRAAMEFPGLRISLNGGVETLDAAEELLQARRGGAGDYSSLLEAHLAALASPPAAAAEVADSAAAGDAAAAAAAPVAADAACVATSAAEAVAPSNAAGSTASAAVASASLFAKLRRRFARLASCSSGTAAVPAPAPAPAPASTASAAACGMCAEDVAEAQAHAATLAAEAAPAPSATAAAPRTRGPSSRNRFRPDQKAIALAKKQAEAEAAASVSPLDPSPKPDAPLSVRCPLVELPPPEARLPPQAHGDATAVLDSVMVGRAAYNNPWILADADRRIFGVPNPRLSRRQVVAAYLDYAEDFLAAGAAEDKNAGLYGQFELIKPIMALFHGKAGGSKFRTVVATASQTERLPIRAAVMKAMALIPDEVLDELPPE